MKVIQLVLPHVIVNVFAGDDINGQVLVFGNVSLHDNMVEQGHETFVTLFKRFLTDQEVDNTLL